MDKIKAKSAYARNHRILLLVEHVLRNLQGTHAYQRYHRGKSNKSSQVRRT